MQINFDDYPETSLDLHETKNYFDLYMRSGSWNINGFSFSGIVAKTSTSNTQDTTGMINLNFGRENLVASECSYTQTHQLFCVQDPKTFVYRKYPSGFKRVPIEYHFALDLSPNAPEAIDVTDTINAGETDSSTETIPVLELEESIQ
jgi:hypothetical protein